MEDSSFDGLLVTMETNKRSVWVRELKKERAENPLLFKGISPLSNEFCLKAWGRASGGASLFEIAVGKLQELKKASSGHCKPVTDFLEIRLCCFLFSHKVNVNNISQCFSLQ